MVFVASFIFGRPAVVLMYTFVEWGRAEKSEVPQGKGYVTTETWACATPQTDMEGAGLLCKELRATRYLLLPEVVLGAVMLALVIWMRLKVSNRRKPDEYGDAPAGSKV